MGCETYRSRPSSEVLIVAHDAGGAEILSSWARRVGVERVSIAGPALAIFGRKLPELINQSVESAIVGCGWVLTGTGWQSDLEWRAIKLARIHGKPSVAFLDHWVGYRERFFRNGEYALPDEFWVGDPHARRLVERTFPGIPVSEVTNPYFADCIGEIAQLGAAQSGRALYLTEPVSRVRVWGPQERPEPGYDEFTALRHFAARLSCHASVSQIVIRPHPTEPKSKYAWAKEIFRVPTVVRKSSTLSEEVAKAEMVIGCETMALVVALLAGRRVYCSIPPGGRLSALPFSDICPV